MTPTRCPHAFLAALVAGLVTGATVAQTTAGVEEGGATATRPTVMAGDIPVAHTPDGYWTTMPPDVLERCTEPLVEGAVDMRGLWQVVASKMNGQPSERLLGSTQRIEQCGDRVVITSGGVVHDMRCDGTLENGVNDVGAPATGGRPIRVSASFENGVHVLRPEGIPGMTVEREIVDGDLIWRYGPALVLRLERIDES